MVRQAIVMCYLTLMVGGRLVLRHRRPISEPYPNHYSHPLPKFRLDPATGLITVMFTCDPEYPDNPHFDGEWRNKVYYLTSIPERKPRTIFDDAAEAIGNVLRSPLAFLQNPQLPPTSPTPDQTFDLRDDEIEEQERAEEGEVDDSEQVHRHVRVVGVTLEEDRRLGDKARARRVWQVLPLRTVARRTGAV